MAITYKIKDAPLTFTRITATVPDCVTKQFHLNEDFTLRKVTTANVSAGVMETVQVENAEGFISILHNLTTDQCLTYGVTGRDKVNLVTEKAWALAGRPDTALPRTAKHMHWSAKGGILMLDYDAPKSGVALPPDELIALLKAACPWLQNVSMVWWASTSSCLYLGDKELAGIRGQRIYIIVINATDIPRIGKVVDTLLWSMNIGRYEISKSGSLLERGLFDNTVYQSNHIDFAAGAKCHNGIDQRRGAPTLIEGEVGLLDSLVAIQDPSPEVIAAAETNKVKAKAEKREEAAKVRLEWVASRVAALIEATPDTALVMKLHTRNMV